VRDVLAAVERVTGQRVPVEPGGRRPGDPAVLYASAARIRTELGWAPRRASLETMVGDAWKWHSAHPHGFGMASR
jgi:UDP-glucose 4-epimerase